MHACEWGIVLYVCVHICLISSYRSKVIEPTLQSGYCLYQHLLGWSQKSTLQVPLDNSDTLRTNELEGLHNNGNYYYYKHLNNRWR